MSSAEIPAIDILYDKIIDVTLYYTEPETQIKTVVSIMGETVETTGRQASIKSSKGLPIAIYKGDTHTEWKKDRYGVRQPIKVHPQGVTLALDTYEDNQNWWNDTSFLHMVDNSLRNLEQAKYIDGNSSSVTNGCNIIVTRNGIQERYHAVYLRSDDEKTSTYHVTGETRIQCTKGNIKPSISFSTNVIPGNGCYKMNLRITNLNLDYDIRSVRRVKITAGYRTMGMQQVFDCPVFSSYIESPNPDGVTVFECLCVGNISSVEENRPINFHYLGGKITISQFIEAIAKGLQVQPHNYLKEDYDSLEMKISGTNLSGKKTYAENAAAAITWARQLVQKRIAAAEGFTGKSKVGSKTDYPYIHMHLTSDGLYVYALNKPNKDSAKITELEAPRDVVALDVVKGAAFNGVALTVKAVWNPRIRPGCLFQMQANIFNGANAPNTLTAEALGRDARKHYYYRCITCSISFSTNGTDNEMSILAVPISYVENSNPLNKEAVQSWDGFVKLSQASFDITGAYDIHFGDPDSKQVDTTPERKNIEVVTTNTNNMFDLDILNYFPTTEEYTIQKGDNLSFLAMNMYKKGNGKCDFDIKPEKIQDLPQGVWEGELSNRAFLWPIIAVVTYRRWKLLHATNVNSDKYESMERLRNPNQIREGKKLVIPVISNFDTLKQCREIFKYAYAAWNDNFPSYGNWARNWVTVYQYLGGTI